MTVRTFSELCLTTGTVIVLFVVYVLYWTGVRARDATDGEIDRLQDRWARAPLPSTAPRTPEPAPPPSGRPAADAPAARGGRGDGDPFAVMYVPRFGRNWDWPVLQGTRTATLQRGLGHYAGTAPLGAVGNFAVAGHRRTYGDPFKDVPRLRPGDAVVLTDGTTWFTYRVDRRPYKTVPSDIGVIDSVPKKSGFDRPGRYLTLTTCEPEWGSSHRLIVWARLSATQPVTEGEPRALRG
ncbi:class E sortase [Streptomyces sp. NPDC057638]|uniref:class E sortase n=1 Tax=Streptomyces sp. NPDC057638 TaxID=3346190 RepID=UPI00367F761B